MAIAGDPASGTFPFTATDSETHAYLMAGMYGLRLTVRDDDGGASEASILVII